jgi:hypothetical protein
LAQKPAKGPAPQLLLTAGPCSARKRPGGLAAGLQDGGRAKVHGRAPPRAIALIRQYGQMLRFQSPENPLMLGFVTSTIAYFVASYYVTRYLEGLGIEKSLSRGLIVFLAASIVAYGVAALTP